MKNENIVDCEERNSVLMVADELREICLPTLRRTMKLAIGKFIAISAVYISKCGFPYMLFFKLMKLDAKIFARRSSMQKLLMSHLMGFNGIQYGCGRHISATRPGGVWAITLVNS